MAIKLNSTKAIDDDDVLLINSPDDLADWFALHFTTESIACRECKSVAERVFAMAFNRGIATAVELLLFHQSDLAPRVNALIKKVPE